ncbi:XtrA/YqaO family protein [Cytobacillus firmus]|uniref:Phage-like element PBSX protein n=1 Tax=Cytobacillus firmus DS1 TaxID=1307436 RepID=W7L010_CYTFI|nr:XtrA/YqaO family protein [Cytobacillus firmus]EWG08871.1 phage-like element PBSX protein [Cytobacillus firmus DS1]
MKRVNELHVNIDNMSIEQKLESGKIKIIVLDGQKGVVSSFEAVHHGETIVETVNGEARRIHFRESEKLF